MAIKTGIHNSQTENISHVENVVMIVLGIVCSNLTELLFRRYLHSKPEACPGTIGICKLKTNCHNPEMDLHYYSKYEVIIELL